MTEQHPAPGAAGPRRQALPPSMRDRVPFLLYRAAELSHALANEMLGRVQLTARQVGILTLVTEWEPMTQKALGDTLRIDRTTMVSLIDDLERKGYVVRQRHPRDRRAFLVEPTPSGHAAKLEAVAILDEQQRRFLAPLTPAQQQQLGELLKCLQRPAGQGDADNSKRGGVPGLAGPPGASTT
ncbi:MAG TPA: MarR family transcriptional regulator [Streptosporangiaceae bacterium]|nr:MarR family transcriptional regulator [Streptosporangiaceae bacterium]